VLAIMMGSFALFAALAFPIVAGLGLSSVLGLVLTTDLSLVVIVQRMAAQLDTFVLLAIPLFVLAGTLMNAGGITERLYLISMVLVGHLRGGLAQVNVLLSVLFGGLSGSSSADAAAEAKILNPIMVKAGYHPEFAAAVTAVSAIVTPVIPPSITMIIYSSITGASVGRLFIAGIVPGILLALAMGLIVHWVSVKRGYGRDRSFPAFAEVVDAVKKSFWGLMMPVIIIVGIRFGVFTATEAAAVAAIYSFLVGMFIHRELKWRAVPGILVETLRDSGIILLIISAAAPFAWILTRAGIPQMITDSVLSITSNPYVFLLIVNVLLLFLGCLVEATSLLVVLTPILAPAAFKLGVDPVVFGLIVCVNINLGTITPPFGQIVFLTSAITGVPGEKVFKESMPFIYALGAVLFLITYTPWSYMWLVDLIGP
jgi:C4-dicarboxylate transporter, DctM subunit